MARTQTLPVKAFPGSTDKKCRQCYSKDETTMHILNMCTASLKMMTERHDAVLGVLTKFLDECDIEYDTSYISLDNLKPDLVIKYNNSCYIRVTLVSTSQFPTTRLQTWNLPLTGR